MSATYLPSGRPPWAVTCWTDDVNVYLELPCVDGPPFIQTYALTENGLGKALSFMRDFHRQHEPKGGTYKIAPHPKLNPINTLATPERRAKVAQLIRGMRPK